MPDTTPTAARAGRREWLGLAVLALPALLVALVAAAQSAFTSGLTVVAATSALVMVGVAVLLRRALRPAS